MSGYGNLKITAAKVGVTLALLALLVGIAEQAAQGPAKVTFTPASAVTQPGTHAARVPSGKIPLRLKGLSPELKVDFKTIWNLVSRLEEEEGIFYFFMHTATKHFLTNTDANQRYLRVGATALNSNKLGGLSPGAFVHGDGGLVSGAATLSGGAKSQRLLSTPGIEVDVAINRDGSPSVTINNSTGVLIPAVQDQGGTDLAITLQPGSNSITPSLQNGVDQLHLQTYPAGSVKRVMTLILSINFKPAQASSSFSGQLIDGGI